MSISGCGSRLLSSSLCIRFLSIMAENPGAKRPRDKEEETNIPKMHSRFPWFFTRSSTSGSGREKNKEYWQKLTLTEKRKQYRCGNRYKTLDKILTWPEFQAKTKCKPAVGEAKYSINRLLNEKVSIWQGDITELEIDAIVNAANSSLLGGGGVDGAIHSAASYSLRDECEELGGCRTGDSKITTGHRLPAKYIIHTVGPFNESPKLLRSCYDTSLQLVLENNIRSIGFCCVATGVYGFPNDHAANIALDTVRKWLETDDNADKIDRVIFVVFLKVDYRLYTALMHHYFPLELVTIQDPPCESTEGEKEKNMEDKPVIPSLQKTVSEPVRKIHLTTINVERKSDKHVSEEKAKEEVVNKDLNKMEVTEDRQDKEENVKMTEIVDKKENEMEVTEGRQDKEEDVKMTEDRQDKEDDIKMTEVIDKRENEIEVKEDRQDKEDDVKMTGDKKDNETKASQEDIMEVITTDDVLKEKDTTPEVQGDNQR